MATTAPFAANLHGRVKVLHRYLFFKPSISWANVHQKQRHPCIQFVSQREHPCEHNMLLVSALRKTTSWHARNNWENTLFAQNTVARRPHDTGIGIAESDQQIDGIPMAAKGQQLQSPANILFSRSIAVICGLFSVAENDRLQKPKTNRGAFAHALWELRKALLGKLKPPKDFPEGLPRRTSPDSRHLGQPSLQSAL